MNIERIKLMKPGLGNTYALVNIPEYEIRVIEDDKTSVKMRVIVGTKKNKTPIFSENLEYITLNPAWNVPDSIARNEIIPDTLKDPGYLKKHRLVIRKDYNLKSPALSFNSVNARAYKGGKGPVPFKFIEVPSDKNALGRVNLSFQITTLFICMTHRQNIFLSEKNVHIVTAVSDWKSVICWITSRERYTARVRKMYEKNMTLKNTLSKGR